MFDALELISRPGQHTHAAIATFALTGAELRAGDAGALRELATPMREYAAGALLKPWVERPREVETRIVRLEGVAWAVEQTPQPWIEPAPVPWYRRLLGRSK